MKFPQNWLLFWVKEVLERPLLLSLLLNIGTTPAICSDNLSVVRLETTKMLLEPLKRLKKADASVNMTQGALEGIVGEELGVLPGMDSIFSNFALEKFVGTLGIKALRTDIKDKFDVVIYDGVSTEETLRLISAASSARLYVKYLRSLAEKTDFGRLASPSMLRLVDEAMNSSGGSSTFNGKLSSEIWDSLERILERGASTFADPQKFGCYIVTDPCNPISVNTALRYWGCTIQAGANISGVLGKASQQSSVESVESVKDTFLHLPFAYIPDLGKHSSLDWDMIISHAESKNARELLQLPNEKPKNVMSPIKFDPSNRCITLFMPGFAKSEIKLYQYRGGSELLVEAGDQRRVIMLPRGIQGKVGGAKFTDRSLVITMK
ncbi:uncharacterized protein At1g26090, chloroplastic-like isoform X2 [Chenopodium quinoa]|uniref:uncharacterized protein At1g26090, chloroplastic-like isoform X2 n=1 Tax=Chenopodium quinoa TaxID=63459 RepID=UPI000B7845D7|nr:uncharacterized protein At1g26090, chloroplastic-like isoform X2 [Chenopodium quinoa]